MDYQKIFYIILLIFFLVFISVFGASKTGYYEYQNKKQTTLTQEKIKEFETDIASGKRVDIKDYLETENVNYNNKITDVGDKISEFITNGFIKGLEGAFKIIEKMIE